MSLNCVQHQQKRAENAENVPIITNETIFETMALDVFGEGIPSAPTTKHGGRSLVFRVKLWSPLYSQGGGLGKGLLKDALE